MEILKIIAVIGFILASIGWIIKVYSMYLESRNKSQYNDPHDVFYH